MLETIEPEIYQRIVYNLALLDELLKRDFNFHRLEQIARESAELQKQVYEVFALIKDSEVEEENIEPAFNHSQKEFHDLVMSWSSRYWKIKNGQESILERATRIHHDYKTETAKITGFKGRHKKIAYEINKDYQKFRSQLKKERELYTFR